ncbi:MAG: tryptophan synthase subunit alpha [Lentisphaeria bacterium]|nr:tryptophan synthase subunit alpha [Lentisphaeria bacterium]
MDRLSEIFASKKPLIVFTTAGYPDPETSERGIAAASQQAAEAGYSINDVLALAGRIREKFPRVGLIVFSYMNPMLHYGYEALCAKLAEIGVDGVLPVDLPLEERDELLEPCRKHGLHMIPLVSPLTPPDRVKAIVDGMSGFVYYINVAGVTGARHGLPSDYPQLIGGVKSVTALPVASGFGIADAETAAEAARHADGVISGSGFVKALGESVEAAGRFVQDLARGVANA